MEPPETLIAEILDPNTLAQLRGFLLEQPPWSELPVLLFVDQPGAMKETGFDLLGPWDGAVIARHPGSHLGPFDLSR